MFSRCKHAHLKSSRNSSNTQVMAHSPPLNIYAIAAMGTFVATYVWIKSPLKYKRASENRLSPKADLAWREGAQKWLDNNSV
ncbi:hypothetical protein OXX79_008836 [Metschnikowia pulcherrima]